jgi:hypothetical protein
LNHRLESLAELNRFINAMVAIRERSAKSETVTGHKTTTR